jgi:tocopherol cyclase
VRLYHPEIFQGSLKNRHYFEGWYFKSIDAGEQNAFAVIPGISLAGDKSHAFIQFLDGPNHRSFYFKYPLADFWVAKDKFEIKIGKSFFSRFKMQLDIDDPQAKITANLDFKNITPWPVSLLSPGVMGWYRFVPKMECYHAVLSFNHEITGGFEINGEKKDFTGGRGYSEKDWGTSMPSSWIWFQTNHFDESGVSIFGSIAKIPWLGSYFTGYIFGLLYRNKIYRFATYTGAKITRLTVEKLNIKAIVEDRDYKLEISASRQEGADLPAPKFGEMSSKVNESLRSKLSVKLINIRDNSVLFAGEGRNAGLEFVGDIEELLKGF